MVRRYEESKMQTSEHPSTLLCTKPVHYIVRSLYTIYPVLLLPIVLISRISHLYLQKPAANIITNLRLTRYAFSHTVWKDFIFLLFVSRMHFRKCKYITAERFEFVQFLSTSPTTFNIDSLSFVQAL